MPQEMFLHKYNLQYMLLTLQLLKLTFSDNHLLQLSDGLTLMIQVLK